MGGVHGSVSQSQFQERLEKLRQLSAALVSSTSHTGRAFSQHFAAKYSPPEIEAMASMEPGGMLVSREVKCWRKYLELSESLDPSSIDRVIMAAITEYAESLMKGLDR